MVQATPQIVIGEHKLYQWMVYGVNSMCAQTKWPKNKQWLYAAFGSTTADIMQLNAVPSQDYKAFNYYEQLNALFSGDVRDVLVQMGFDNKRTQLPGIYITPENGRVDTFIGSVDSAWGSYNGRLYEGHRHTQSFDVAVCSRSQTECHALALWCKAWILAGKLNLSESNLNIQNIWETGLDEDDLGSITPGILTFTKTVVLETNYDLHIPTIEAYDIITGVIVDGNAEVPQ